MAPVLYSPKTHCSFSDQGEKMVSALLALAACFAGNFDLIFSEYIQKRIASLSFCKKKGSGKINNPKLSIY